MPFSVSPAVNVSEIDLTTVVPTVSTTEGAIAGVFRWGPLDKILLVDSEHILASRYGKPTNHNPETWFTAADFLAYGNKLYVSRCANTTDDSGSNGVLTAVANVNIVTGNTSHIVKNEDHYETVVDNFDSDVLYVARYPGALGNSLRVSICDTANQYQSNIDLIADYNSNAVSNATISFAVGSNSATVSFSNATGSVANDTANAASDFVADLVVGDVIEAGNSSIGKVFLEITSIGSVTKVDDGSGNDTGVCTVTLSLRDVFPLSTAYSANNFTRRWEHYNLVDTAPGQSTYMTNFGNTSANDELHVVVTDEDGQFTGVKGQVLEVWEGLSRATDAKLENGTSNYYKTIINQNSRYVWWANDRTTSVSNIATNVASGTSSTPLGISFILGSDGDNENVVPISVLAQGYDKFRSSEDVDVSLILTGKSKGGTNGEQLPNYLIDNIAEVRKDCVVFVSPERADVVNNGGLDEAADIVTFRNGLRSTSYAVIDSGYKYRYDKYNDVYRFTPLNGDVAGLCVRTDNERDPWWSPAGFNRGQIKNIIKLAYNPRKADRDILYKAGVNPVVSFPGQGTILYGDKTALAKPSAFDRINVRRLFIVLEKAIATAAQYSLFEFNDEFTRAQFVNLVEPFLRDVQGRRGITDFRVVCNETNNTGEVIDRNEFIGDIYIKPSRSINYIQLNFVAVRTDVEFNEVVGSF